jgi:endonuclease/exonuclease/phosphatase family metal-dependent hydrolase
MFSGIKFLLIAAMSLTFTVSCNRKAPTPAPTPAPIDPVPVIPVDPNNPEPVNNAFIELKILTLNVWGLPNPITKDLVKRFTKIGPAINGYDLVNLQETFSDHADDKIFGVADYQSKIRFNNTSFLTIGSGLGSLTKYPIVKKGFKKFSQCAGSDCMSNKGVFFMRINVPPIGDVDIYNTHYQAISDKEDIRVSDNKELQELLRQNEAGNLTILTGDFNFNNTDPSDSKSKAFLDFKKRFKPIDTFRIANPEAPGFTSVGAINPYADKNDKPERLDYIFVLPENRGTKPANYTVEVAESNVIFDQPVDGTFLSDHFGLTTTLRIHLED